MGWELKNLLIIFYYLEEWKRESHISYTLQNRKIYDMRCNLNQRGPETNPRQCWNFKDQTHFSSSIFEGDQDTKNDVS